MHCPTCTIRKVFYLSVHIAREVKNRRRLDAFRKYLSKISDIRFSHGVCDNCMEKHFPDVIEVWNKKDFFEDGQKKGFLDS